MAAVLREVSDALWRERRLLELLQFKLEEERLVTRAGQARWVHRASREVALVRGELRRADLARAVAVEAAAAELGLGPAPKLRDLAVAAPPPWDGILHRHHEALVLATRQVSALAERCTRALDERART